MIKGTIKEILKSIKGDYFEIENNLLTDGYINSFDLIAILAKIEETFSVSIPIRDLRPEDFDSVTGICDIVNKYQKQ